MAGLFGTRALLQTDVNLLLQTVIVAILVISYFYRRNAKKHGAIVGVAMSLEIVTVLLFMGPEFIKFSIFFFTKFTPIFTFFLINIISGAFALVLGVGLSVAWAFRFFNVTPCYSKRRKRIMVAAIILWIVSFAFGVAGYVLAYV